MEPSIVWTSEPGPYVMGMVAVGDRLAVAKAGYRISAGVGSVAEEHAAATVFLSRSTGEILNSISLGEPESVSPPCLLPDRGIVLTMRSGKGIVAVALGMDAEIKWRRPLESERDIAPVAAGPSTVLVPLTSRTGFTGVACLDANDGKVSWQAPARSNPVVDEKERCVCVDVAGRVVGLSVESGETLFQSERGGFVHSFLVSGEAYGMLDSGEACSVSASSGTVGVPHRLACSVREIMSMRSVDSSAIVATEGEVQFFSLADGRVAWKKKSSERNDLLGSFEGRLYLSGKESIMALDAGSGQEAWRLPVPGTVVAVAFEDHQTLNVATFEGAAFGIRVIEG